ncbi:3'(2'),5'-bisphosphate nucleotidase CysQ [Thioalkalivibrio sulfidiphilus]|uniref:3'(2'),5'-bisphosphate nucleotidase CysQ n=1 Tax=Thioalkalivibrio sulfidiphilus TaxID=1033854 RepID=UPI000374891B|nr:3'(2'),5'-bisphosphate nucleotidase CysQ [Thioalkalivibrio sulfidiphilus]
MFNPDDVVRLAKAAGDAVMAIYRRDFAVYEKDDQSPLTEADLASHRVLVEGLGRITPEIPVLSEESVESHSADRLVWSRYWLIDPLDGTKEFVKKNGEFTVNVALIEDSMPVFGVVHAPVLGVTYWGKAGEGAYKESDGDGPGRISVSSPPEGREGWRVVGSRSHQSEEFRNFMERLPDAEMVAMGSSLKLCLVAEGAADLYPRLGLTSEWDTAAAQAVVEAAGGQVLEYPGLAPLRYNTRPETLLNPHFIVCTRPSEVWTRRP